jgi:CRISPR-associated protein Cas2
MNSRWYVVVSYDIADTRRRSKVARVLKAHGERVQKSVFDCLLDDRRLLELQAKLKLLIDENVDSVRYYRLCSRCEGSIDVQGFGTVQEDEDIILV